jgi:hypothetical protein
MAHFAILNESNVITNVVVVNNDVIIDNDGVEQEQLGVDFLTELYGPGNYVQTSYNRTIRERFAGIGGTYDVAKNKFISIQPFPSWTLDGNDEWKSPTPMPDDGKFYEWNETTTSWNEIDINSN